MLSFVVFSPYRGANQANPKSKEQNEKLQFKNQN